MASPVGVAGHGPLNPLDLIEDLVTANEWAFDRPSEQELMVGISAGWCSYQLWFAWRHDPGVLQFCCAFDLKVPKEKLAAIHALLARVNESMWLGHFCMSYEDGTVMFRHAHLISTGTTATLTPYEALIEIALCECERYYPAFQLVLWGGKTPQEAIAVALLEPIGHA